MIANVVYNVPSLPMYWDWRVAADLFFGGIGVGAFLFAVLADWRYGDKQWRVCQTAAWIAPAGILLGLIFLLMEMSHPARLVHAFTDIRPTSPLWWGGIFQLILIPGAFRYAALWRDPETNAARRRGWGLALLPVAIIVGAYHGFLLTFIRARPLWNNGPTLVAAILGFVTTGIAAVMLVHLIRSKFGGRLGNPEALKGFLEDMREVRTLLGVTLMLQICTLFIWWVALSFGWEPAQVALAAANAAYGPMFWYGAIGLGLVVPIALGALVIARGDRVGIRLELNTIWITSALILVGGFLIRHSVVLAGQLA